MENNRIVTIGRQWGSNGKIIGKELARQLGIPFYDKELLNVASKESGIAKKYFEEMDEKKPASFLGGFPDLSMPFMGEGYIYYSNYLDIDTIFKIQSDAIKLLAEKESCVFIGRCADYILQDNPECVSVFITADKEDRIQNAERKEKKIGNKAEKYVDQMDKKRASYYQYYTDKIWGMASSYDLCINSSKLSIEQTASAIRYFAEKRWAK